MIAYQFTVTLLGYGNTPDKAWQDAAEGFSLDPGPTPEAGEYKLVTHGVTEVWQELRDVPIDENDAIEVPFLQENAGTHREEIWHWIEEKYDVGVYDLMTGKRKKEE